jgi:TetR/AcrR family transcriptional regulator, tetracycline repressor protein
VPRKKDAKHLSRERLVQAALSLVDEGGLEALTMRRLGTALEVDPMAVYYHVPDKQSLLRFVVEAVFASMPAPDAAGPWQQQLRAWAYTYRDLALAHPNLVLQIVSDPATVAVAAVQVNETLYAAVEASGIPPDVIEPAAGLVVDFVNGYVLGAARPAPGSEGTEDSLTKHLREQGEAAFPVQHRVLLGAPQPARESFELGLDVIVAGIESLAGTTGRGRAPSSQRRALPAR